MQIRCLGGRQSQGSAGSCWRLDDSPEPTSSQEKKSLVKSSGYLLFQKNTIFLDKSKIRKSVGCKVCVGVEGSGLQRT